MGDYSQLISCSIGSAEFQMRDYGVKSEPVIKDGLRTGTKSTVTGEGWVQGSDAADLATKIAGVIASLSLSGQDLVVTGLAGVPQFSLLAAQCLSGGPHVSFEVMPAADEPLTKKIQFTAVADRPGDSGGGGGGGGGVANTFKVSTAVRPDGLRTVTIGGEINGLDSGDWFTARVIPGYKAAYPLPGWVLNYQSETSSDASKTKTTYTISAEEQTDPLPAAQGGIAVQGTASTRVERDEQMRRVTVYQYDLLVDGDPVSLLTLLRPQNVTILRESMSVTALREQRLSASFTVLDGGNGNDLLDWQQSFGVERSETNQLESATYPGASLLLYKTPVGPQRWTQSGKAVGAGRFPQPPAPIFEVYAGPSQLHFASNNAVECETTWTYNFLFDAEPLSGQAGGYGAAIVAKLGLRPENPLFY